MLGFELGVLEFLYCCRTKTFNFYIVCKSFSYISLLFTFINHQLFTFIIEKSFCKNLRNFFTLGKPGKGSEERVSAQERLGTRRGARDWDDRDEGGDSRDIDSRRQSWARGGGDSPRRLVGGGRGRAKLRRGSDRRSGGERGIERNDDVNGWKREGRPTARGKRKPSGPIGGRESAGGGKKDLFRPRSRQKSGEKLSRDLRDNLNAMEDDNSGNIKIMQFHIYKGKCKQNLYN